MRVVAGLARGHKLICLDGEAIRPTSDRAKEAIFSALGMKVQESRFLDMFSGSGAIGIEALSRGADYVVFVEQCAEHVEVIKKNIAHVSKAIGLDKPNYKLVNKDAIGALDMLKLQELRFGIIFLDPPYDSGLWKPVLSKLAKLELLDEGGIIVLELGADEDEPALSHFEIVKKKVYGAAAVYYMEICK